MARRLRTASRPAAANLPRRQNPPRDSKSRITQLADLSTDSELELDDDVANGPGLDDSESENDGLDYVIDADDTSRALDIPARTRASTSRLRHRPRNTGQRNKNKSLSTSNNNDTIPPKRKPPKRRRRDSGPSRSRPSPKRSKQVPVHEPETTIHSQFIPDWKDARIPFDFWVDIFYYAAHDAAVGGLATNWLLQAATSCKYFTEPALNRLYRCPIIRSQKKAKKLAALLEQPVSLTQFNYRAMIEDLHIDIHVVPSTIMYQLIHPLPRLKELIICTVLDQPPYRELEKSIRWHYPADVFEALLPQTCGATEAVLKSRHTLLKSWEWSGRLLGGHVQGLSDLGRIHELPSFRSLTRISFTNFQIPSLRKRSPRNTAESADYLAEDNADIERIAASLAKLPALTHLVFESCTVLNDHMLSLLPRGLLHLELINCWEVDSGDLAAFLREKGGDMQMLSLHHNQSLDLGFLTDLADTCPRLRELDMNMSYFKLYESANDSEPMYDQVLLPDQVPRWPGSIRAISIEHARNWSVEAVEMFLQTLIDSAERLPNLRHLSVKTMLDIPWQSRATMRTAWREKMEKVFLRPQPRPPSRATTLQNGATAATSLSSPPLSPAQPSRRSTRIAAHEEAFRRESNASSAAAGGGGSSSSHQHPPDTKLRKSYREPDTDEDEDEDEDELSQPQDSADDEADDDTDRSSLSSLSSITSSGGNDVSSWRLPVQGLCRTVNIVLDNQKVRELQYGMEDFQTDNVPSDDDDEWNGDYESDDPVVQF